MCKVLFFIVIQVKPYLKQKFLTHQSSSFLLIQEMFIGFHHPLNLKKNFKLLFFGRLKRLPYFHVLLSKCKDLKSAPCFLSSPRGLILVANWLFRVSRLTSLSLLIDTSVCQSFSDSFYFRSREQGDLSPNSEINCWVKLSL